MLIEKDVQKLINQLAGGNTIQVPCNGSAIVVRAIDDASKLLLTASVYEGGNYIPAAVRRCLSRKVPPHSYPSILTFLTVDEEHFQIQLNYLGHADFLHGHIFKELLEEFGLLAENWRHYLDEHDRNDRVHVRVN